MNFFVSKPLAVALALAAGFLAGWAFQDHPVGWPSLFVAMGLVCFVSGFVLGAILSINEDQ